MPTAKKERNIVTEKTFSIPRFSDSLREISAEANDAIDLAVDANRDGRVNSKDTKLVTMAVDIVEKTHPDLVGGMGIYVRNQPYVHIDARGIKVRWRG